MTERRSAVEGMATEAKYLADAAERLSGAWDDLGIDDRLLALAAIDASVGRLLSTRADLARLLGEQWVRR